jgi:hypothetical protein
MAEDPRDIADDDETGETRQLPSSSPGPTHRYPADEVLPSHTVDEQSLGWGDGSSEYGDDWFLEQRPPHHG